MLTSFRVAGFLTFTALLFAQSQPELRTGILHGHLVTYEVQGPYAVVQGDIILGTVAEIDAASIQAAAASSASGTPQSATLAPVYSANLWPNATIPYVIDPTVPSPQVVSTAVKYWNSVTPLHLVPWTNQANYVIFTLGGNGVCDSSIGMIGGPQVIQLDPSCTAGNVVHEIGHAFGLFHEQTRNDRNAYVTILYDNIDKRYRSNFDQEFGVISDASYYDYDSIMHYSPYSFTRNNQATIETVPIGIPIGQLSALSAGDIDGVSRLYGFIPTSTTVTTIPAGLKVVVDGTTVISPHSFKWAPGSTHTVQAPALQGADPRYAFVRWTDGGADTHSLTASANMTVLAAVFATEHSVSAGTGAGSGSVSITPSTVDGYYPERMTVRVQAFAYGDQFLGWAGLTDFYNNSYGLSTASADLDIFQPEEQFSALFTGVPMTTVDSQPSRLPVLVDGIEYLTPIHLLWNAGEKHTLYTAGPVYWGDNTVRYNLRQWEDGSTGVRTIKAGSGPATYIATFSTQYLLSTASSSGGQVVVSPPSVDGYYNAGTTVQVTAVPTSGSVLRYWLFDTEGAPATQTVQMTEDRVAAASFGPALSFRVVNAAGNDGNSTFDQTGSIVAPGELVVLYGANIGPTTALTGTFDANQLLPKTLGGFQVLFDGNPAPILYASANQINVLVPSPVGQTSSTTAIQVNNGSTVVATSQVSAAQTAPSFFTMGGSGRGAVTAFHADGTPVTAANPAAAGSIVTLYATGTGNPSQPIPDGQKMGATLIPSSSPIAVRIGKFAADVIYAGSLPGSVNGMTQIMVHVPSSLLSGSTVPIQLIAGQANSSSGVTIAIQ